MDREFRHTFSPTPAPFSGPARLTVDQVEDAGLLEVLQSPGARFGHWRILDQLLAQDSEFFVFREPLGQSREVKVALSGLFGRFVARAYLTRHMKQRFFTHVTLKGVVLDQSLNLQVFRKSRGDLPDWIAAPAAHAPIMVAEAKGSHDPAGPARALKRAWKQANRIRIERDGQRLTVKRLAVVTRWGVSAGGPSTPWIAVQDPVEEGEVTDSETAAAAFVGIVRHHIANLVEPLGHPELAASIRALTSLRTNHDRRTLVEDAHGHLEDAAATTARSDDQGAPLIGGIASRAGPLQFPTAPPEILEALDSLDVRPAFVGLNRDLAWAAIQGDAPGIRAAAEEEVSGTSAATRDDAASGTRNREAAERADAAGDRGHPGARVIRLTNR